MRNNAGTAYSGRILMAFAGLIPVALCAAPDSNRVEVVEEEPPARLIRHAGIGAAVEVSSTHTGEPGEGPASAMVDGNLATRWSSDYSEPQEVKVDLGRTMALARVRLHWERASAMRYSVMASTDGKEWVNVHLLYMKTRGEPEARVDSINLNGLSARFIRLDLLGCANKDWGFSLYEVEVVEAVDGNKGGGTGGTGDADKERE